MKRARGISLIEVLVSLVILSLGVLAVVALQMIAKRNNADAGARTIAAQLAYDMIERMRSNSTSASLANYQTGAAFAGRGNLGAEPNPTCTEASPCTETQLVAHDLWVWEQALDGRTENINSGGVTTSTGGLLLPTGCITGPAGGGDGLYTVTIAWRGTVQLPDVGAAAVPCGSAATDAGGTRIYGDNDVYRRTISLQVYITARRRAGV